jgi:hypothetical protein
MTKSGFCQFPSDGSHKWCRAKNLKCDCGCHTDPEAYPDTVYEKHVVDTDTDA